MINIKTDSRKVKKGDIFVALPGINSNGNEYIDKAIENGASTIVCETGEYKVETIHTDNPRNYLLNYLKEHYQSIMNKMMFVGITGTNGKTTSSFLLSELCNRLGKKSAYIGTIGFYIGNEKRRNLNNTTPDICDLYELFIEACEENCECIVLEVSSQGLSYGRLDGISFDVGVFTNLTQDHLDYHKTMENYALAKQKLFYNIKENGFALINSDDSYKDYYLLDGNKNITYGFFSGDYRVIDYEMTHLGMIFTYVHNDEEVAIKTNLTGKYNISNLLTSIIILEQIGYKSEEIKKEVLHLESPSGRMEMIPYRESLIVIDYAHTPDAMTKIISTMKEDTNNSFYSWNIIVCRYYKRYERRTRKYEL